MDEDIPGRPQLSRREVVRQTNANILELAGRLASVRRDARPVGLFCECGCFRIVETTVADYEANGGAWFPGHETGPRD